MRFLVISEGGLKVDSVEKIREALGIEREAVGVKYSDESPIAKVAEGQYSVCDGILRLLVAK